MSGPALLFREIHRLRRFAQGLQEQIDRMPRLFKAQQARVLKQEETQHQNQEAIKHLKVSIHQKEVSLKSTHSQIARYKSQMETAAHTKEIEALKTQIGHAQTAAQKLEDEILAEMTEVEERTAKVPELEQAVKQIREEYARFEAVQKEKNAAFATQLEQARAQIKEVEEKIPAGIRSQYDRIVTAKGPDGFSCVRKRVCEACATTITPQSYQELTAHQFVTCKACGRILHPPEEVLDPTAPT